MYIICYTEFPTLIISYGCNGHCTELDSDEEAADIDAEKAGQSSRGRDRSKAYVYKNYFAPLLVEFFPNFHLEETEEESSK